MAIFKKTKTENGKEIKLFAMLLSKVDSDFSSKSISFLGNLISISKSEENNVETKTIKLFNKEVLKRICDKSFIRQYFLGKLFKTVKLVEIFNKKYAKFFKGYDDILVLNSNSGEAYLILTYVLKPFLAKNKCKNFLLVLTKKYHVDLLKMIQPSIPYVYINKPKVLRSFVSTFENKTFYTFFIKNHFLEVEKDIRIKAIGTAHYFKSILEAADMEQSELSFENMRISKELSDEVLAKAQEIGLNLNKFVFIAPEAISCDGCGREFWLALCKELEDLGYDVFMNIALDACNLEGCKYKTFDLSFAQAFALAKMSKGIVSLRSGLTECLLQAEVPSFVLYTKFRNRYVFNDIDVDHAYAGFALNALPNIDEDLLFEYKLNEFSSEEIIKDIIKNLLA